MLQTLKLLLPALIPSWRFFDTIAPSPRIEFVLLKTKEQIEVDSSTHWQEFRPRPAHLPVTHMLKRMLWNPRWNESLFLVSCSERLMDEQSERKNAHSRQEIFSRIKAEIERTEVNITQTPYLQFRLVFVLRNEGQLEKHITYLSTPRPLDGIDAS